MTFVLGGAPASAQSSSAPVPPSAPALEVPYLPQSVLLCGGAAVAMVERYWGKRGVYAEDFATLVRPEEGGIRTDELARAARARGWEASAFDGTPEQVQYLLARQIPVIALIEVARERYHYVVLLQWEGGQVLYHDPAIAPHRSVPEATFLRSWNGGAHWAMAVRPAATPDSTVTTRATAPLDSTPLPCAPYLDQAIDSVKAGRLDVAGDLLREARTRCPAEPLVARELAGVRFKQRRYLESAFLAEEYVTRVEHDTLGWRILATSHYLTQESELALRAWNRVGAPKVDLIRIDGIRRTRFNVIAKATDIDHGEMLTPKRLLLANRRVDDIPALAHSHASYFPVGDGLAEVRLAVAERPLIEPFFSLVVGNGLRGLVREEVSASFANVVRAGELWEVGGRWDQAHQQAALGLAVPMRIGVSGTVEVDGLWERRRFDIGGSRVEESRRSGGLTFGGWVLPALRPSMGLRLDRWSGDRSFLAVTSGAELREADDRLTIRSALEWGPSLNGASSYWLAGLTTQWASSHLLTSTLWSVRAGVNYASRMAPAGLWPAASGDVPLAIPLRAHPYNQNDRLPTGTIGRLLLHGGAAVDQPIYRTGPFTFALGVFVDGAQVNQALSGGRDRFLIDAGGGLRLGLLDGLLGVLRIDVATGLNEDVTGVTVGLEKRWPL